MNPHTFVNMLSVVAVMTLNRAREHGVMDRGMYRRNKLAFQKSLESDRKRIETGEWKPELALAAINHLVSEVEKAIEARKQASLHV